jgi:hypothetical protein
LEFSTILAFPNFLNFYVDKYISLTFIYFCLDKGVHFTLMMLLDKTTTGRLPAVSFPLIGFKSTK